MPDESATGLVSSTQRRTLAQAASVQGVTLFAGHRVALEIRPAEFGSGLRFVRGDMPGTPAIPALVRHVAPEQRRTVLMLDAGRAAGPDNPSVQTTEHVLSALAGLGVTDAELVVSGAEVPMGDGSAGVFVRAIRAAGLVDGTDGGSSGAQSSVARVVEPIVIADERAGWRLEAKPTARPGLEVEYRLEYPPGAGIPAQVAEFWRPLMVWGVDADRYAAEIGPARTFSLAAEAQAARAMGLFAHLEPKDTLVIGTSGPIDNAYRFPNEPARHKLLDVLGDLALVGRPIQARVVATRSGHAQNHELARRLAALG